MIRVTDIDATVAFFRLIGLEEVRRFDNEKGRFTLVFLAAPGQEGTAEIELDLGRAGALVEKILQDGDPDFALRGQLAGAIGTRPDRNRLRAILDLARAALAERVTDQLRNPGPTIEAHAELVRLTGEVTTYNYDAGLLAMEIGTLLATAAQASDRADA